MMLQIKARQAPNHKTWLMLQLQPKLFHFEQLQNISLQENVQEIGKYNDLLTGGGR